MKKDVVAVPPLAELDPKARIRQILAISLPIIGALTSQNVLNIVDTWLVGLLGSMQLACVALGANINWVLTSFFIGLGAGVQTLVARRVGENKIDDAPGALNRALWFIAVIVVPFSIVVAFFSESILDAVTSSDELVAMGAPYLAARLAGLPFTAANFAYRGFWNGLGLSNVYMRTLITIHVINAILSYALVFGRLGLPELGLVGAGIGTSVSQAIGTLVYHYLAVRMANNKPDATPSRTSLRTLLKLGVPAGMQSLSFSVGFLVFFIITDKLGTAALGASQVLVTMLLVSVLPAVGLGIGCTSLVGQAMGAKRPDDAKTWGWLTAGLGAVVVGVLGLAEALTARTWLHLFIPNDPVAAELGVLPLQIIGSVMAIDVVGVVLSNALIGAGATLQVMFWSVFFQYGLFLPLAWYFGVEMNWGLPALWWSFAIYRTLFGVAMVILWKRGNWRKLMI